MLLKNKLLFQSFVGSEAVETEKCFVLKPDKAFSSEIDNSTHYLSSVAHVSSFGMDTNQDLEAQYSPSHFSERFKTPDEVINHHIEFISKGEWIITLILNRQINN